MGHVYIALTLIFTVYGQLVMKWQVSKAGALPDGLADKAVFLGNLLLNGWIISALASACIAAIAWMAAMTKFELGYAYPFMSLAFILVMLFSVVFLREPVSFGRVLGTGLVVAGLFILTR